MSTNIVHDVEKIVKVTPIGSNPSTGYPEIVCPNCKRHFYWRAQDKEFYCICGEVIIVKKE